MKQLRIVWLVALATSIAAGCNRQDSSSSSSAPAVDPSSAAQNTPNQVGILIKDVQTVGYDGANATQCQVLYNAYNNTQYHLYSAHIAPAGYDLDIGDLSANAHFASDQTFTVDPINNSCAGVADKLIASGSQLGVTTCQMEKLTEGQCQANVVGYVSVDKGTSAKLRQADQAAAQQLAAQQAQQFEQDKAAAWAQRGQYEAPVGTTYALANPGNVTTLNVVLAPDFDPTKLADGTSVDTSALSFCAADPNTGQSPNGTLSITKIVPDKFGLADWYQLKITCPDEYSSLAWISASAIDNLIQAAQLQKSA